jgi:hypothetical protein
MIYVIKGKTKGCGSIEDQQVVVFSEGGDSLN